MQTYDIYKSAAVIIKDRKLLLTHEKGKEFFVSPGGKVEKGESPLQCVIRELQEEVCVLSKRKDFVFLETFYAPAAGQESKILRMGVYILNNWSGEPVPNNLDEEIDEIVWVNTQCIPKGIKIGSIFEHFVMPILKQKDLID